VVFVDTTEGLTVSEFADETARINSLGVNDALLVVALDDRTDFLWVSDSLPITDPELDEIVANTLEPGLAAGDFAGAVIASADALGRAAEPEPAEPPQTFVPLPPEPTEPGGGVGLVAIVGILLLGVGLVVVALWLVGRFVAWRETGERSRRTANLARVANAQLIAADDRIRAAEQETGFVEAEFGESEADPFRAAIAEAKPELRAAFALRQRLDDSDPEDPPTREAMLNQIIEASKRANAALDAQAERIEQLRSLQRDAPAILAALPAQIEPIEARLPAAEQTLAGFAAYAESAWVAVKGHATEARKGLAGAREAIARGNAAVATDRARAAREIVTAQRGIAGAAALLDAVDKLATSLRDAAAGLEGELDAATQDLADARAAMESAPEIDPQAYSDRLAQVRADIDSARVGASARPLDPLAAAKAASAARRAAAELEADVRADAEQAARFAAAVSSSINAAQAEVDRAADFIATRRTGVGRRARTRLAEAERLLEQALALYETDPKNAMARAQRADKLAGEAYTLATHDFARWDAGRGGPAGGGAGSGSDVAGAILGGIIGGILSGGGRGNHAGWGGSSWGSPGGGGGGGGWGGGGHGVGGSFGGFGGGGGGGGHGRGGRW
jgi:predicted  nucleic acid-binding Zn-ribbon protein